MDLHFNLALIEHYKNTSQKIRVISEDWFAKNMFCPCCGNPKVVHFENNRPVADFYCEKCNEQFELKSTDKKIENKITDGAYFTAIQRITRKTNPDLFFLQYRNFMVENLTVVPKYFFTPEIIEKRKPLSENARRAGWTGCNILLGKIPLQGKIPIIHAGKIIETEKVVNAYRKSLSLQTDNIENRGWLFDVLNCVNSIKSEKFDLNAMYKYENELKSKHPNNNNIQAKIRQQLQELRDRNIISFLGQGRYKKV